MLLVFAASDKGGTGRSVTSSNVLYRSALAGNHVCYLDFDFGSPTAGAIFGVDGIARGLPHDSRDIQRGGLHRFLHGEVPWPHSIDVWAKSERKDLRAKPLGAGRLALYPGDQGGGEFQSTEQVVRRCVQLFLRLQEEFDVCLVDLSAGRSEAVKIVLEATAQPDLANSSVVYRWLIFHRWTRQHIGAAYGLVHGERGLLGRGANCGHDLKRLETAIRFVRTAVVEEDSPQLNGMRPAQIAWLRDCDRNLRELASRYRLGRTSVVGKTPLEPMLQWREQLITDDDVWATQVANAETVKAFEELARAIVDDMAWEGM